MLACMGVEAPAALQLKQLKPRQARTFHPAVHRAWPTGLLSEEPCMYRRPTLPDARGRQAHVAAGPGRSARFRCTPGPVRAPHIMSYESSTHTSNEQVTGASRGSSLITRVVRQSRHLNGEFRFVHDLQRSSLLVKNIRVW